MKKLTFRGMLDNLRSSVAGVADAVTGANKFDSDPDENVRPQDFLFSEVSRHGFPQDPTAIAFEPVQRVLAIGTRQGSIRLIGRPGVDYFLKQPSGEVADRDALFTSSSSGSSAVLQISFLINEGTFIVLTGNSWLHLWNYKARKPEIVQSLEFTKETLTVCHVPYQSKWIFVGTDKGNVHIIQVESFTLSGYVINWNKAMELSSRNHPGKIIHLSDCPCDSTKLLIGFDSGLICLWDLKAKQAEVRFQAPDTLCYISWHFDGKQFVSSHSDATLAVWTVKGSNKPVSVTSPHARRSKDDAPVAISQVEWKKHKSGSEPLLLFSGGVVFDQKASRNSRSQTMTIIHGKSTTVLEMEHPIVSFLCIPSQPWSPEGCENDAVVLLLDNDLVAIDLSTPGYPLFENPYPMDLHEPPLLHCYYVADCPSDLIPTLYTTGAKQKKSNFTDKDWPIDGGQWGSAATGYSDFLLTSHAEGTLRFWDVSSASLQHLDKIKIAKIFERSKKSSAADNSLTVQKNADGVAPSVRASGSVPDGSFDVQMVIMDDDCRYLAVACVGGFVILYLWNKQETTSEVAVLNMVIQDESRDSSYPAQPNPSTLQNSSTKPDILRKVKIKPGLHKRAPGFQPILVCFTGSSAAAILTEQNIDSATASGMITSLAISSKHGLLAVGNDCGLAVADIIQKHCVMRLRTPDLYGPSDPYNRGSKSPPREKTSLPGTNDQNASQNQHLDAVNNNQATASSVSPKHGPTSAAGASASSSGKTKHSSLEHKPKLQRDKHGQSQASPRLPRSHILQRMQSLAYSFESDLIAPRHHAPRQSSRDRAIHASLEKADLSRSRSSSSSEMDVILSEAVLSLKFGETYGKRADLSISPCLWIGTELGSVLVVTFQMPSTSADPSQPQQAQRLAQPVIGIPTGTLFRFNNSGAVICIGLLDARGAILTDNSTQIRPELLMTAKEEAKTAKPAEGTGSASNAIPNLISLLGDPRHILVTCFERQIRTCILPNQGTYQKLKLSQDNSSNNGLTFLKCTVQKVRDNACAFCHLSSGKVALYSLPTLKPLLEVQISSPNDLRAARTLSFSQHGNAVYMVSKSEIQKVTFLAETSASLAELSGELYTAREVVEPAKVSAPVASVGFLKGLIGSSAPVLTLAQQVEQDRNELFGEAAGKASKTVARHIPGTTAMDQARTSSNMANSEIGRAKLLAIERGEKLSEIEEAAERMRLQAEAFSSNAHQLANKYKDKKWYQI